MNISLQNEIEYALLDPRIYSYKTSSYNALSYSLLTGIHKTLDNGIIFIFVNIYVLMAVGLLVCVFRNIRERRVNVIWWHFQDMSEE